MAVRRGRGTARGLTQVATVVAVLFASSFPAFAGTSPQGDTAVAWPTAWNAYRMADGTAVQDVLGDENPDNADLSSGPCAGSGCTGGAPTVYYASDGTNAFFRVRLAVDPGDATKGGLTGNAYLAQIAVDGTVRAVVGVDGKSASVDYVYTATAPGTTVTSIYEYPFTSPSAGMRVVNASPDHWFLDYQVPIARITTASGGTITAATPIQLYFGSSAAANLATINKDFMLGAATAVSFDDLSVVSLSPGAVGTTSAAAHVSGPNPPFAGSASTYDLTLTLTNPGGGEVTDAVATATLPAGVTYVSGPVTMNGSALTWSAGSLLPGQTKTVTVRVSLTPAAGGATPLLSAVSASAVDLATSAERTATAPALTVTADAPPPPPNSAPVAGDDELTVAEDGSGAVNVLADDTDADDDPLTVSDLSDPAHGSVTVTGGVVTYTPDAGYHGPDSFSYDACDPSGACSTATVTVTVTPVNDAPAAPPASSFSTPEDTPHSGSLPGSTDPEDDPLTFHVADEPLHGELTLDEDGDYTYTPDPDYYGPDSFTYEVCDPAGACASATVTVTVTPDNDGPPAPPASAFSTPEDTPRSGSVPGVADVDGDDLTFRVVEEPLHGELTLDEDGDYTYTPHADYHGPDSFTYEVCDPAGACASALVTVTVTPVNDPPAPPPPSSFSTPEDTEHDGTLPGSTDPDGDALTFDVVTEPAHGELTVNEDGAYTYTPDADYSGPDSFTYEVCDPDGACASATVTVTVTPVNDAPAAPPASAFSTPEDTEHDGTLPGSTDRDGDALTFHVVDEPLQGELVLDEDGGYTYTPDPGYHGPDSFTYEVCDPSGACASATVTVTVTPVNDPPTPPPASSFSTPEDTPHDGTLPGSVDPDGDALTFSEGDAPAHGDVTIQADGDYVYTPDANYSGPDSFTYDVCDPDGACASATVTVTVTPVNDAPPTPAGGAITTPEDTPHSGTLSGSTDVDGDALTFGGTDEPAHGDVTIDADGDYTYTPDPDYSGPDSFGYELCDPAGACAGATVTVTVTPVNDPPVAADDAVPTAYGVPVTFDPTGNDSDVDSDVLTISVPDPAHGSVAVTGTSVVYTPDEGFTGPDTFTYTVCDAADACDTATITVTVGIGPALNLPPVADAGDDRKVPSGEAVSLDGTGSSDPDLDLLTYSWVQVSGPPVTLAGADTATPSFAGLTGPAEVVFELTVSDGALSDAARVTIGFAPPVAEPEAPAPDCDDVTVTTDAGGIDITIPCTEDDDATIEVVDGPGHGDVVVLDTGEVRYEPDAGFTGTDVFTVRVCTAAGCTESEVTVIVPAVPVVPPVVRPRPVPNLPVTGSAVDVLVGVAFAMLLAGASMQRRPRKA